MPARRTARRSNACSRSSARCLATSSKVYTAADGERCTIVEFDTEEHQRAWATHAEHIQAKQKGRDSFYSEYRLQVCTVLRDSRFPKP